MSYVEAVHAALAEVQQFIEADRARLGYLSADERQAYQQVLTLQAAIQHNPSALTPEQAGRIIFIAKITLRKLREVEENLSSQGSSSTAKGEK